MRRTSLYPRSLSGSSTEIDLRAGFDDIVYGANGNMPHGYYVLIRYLRRNDDGTPIACTCVDSLTKEASPDCVYCQGEGALWDEQWATTFSVSIGASGGLAAKFIQLPPGDLKVDYKVFYLRYDSNIDIGDKIIEVELDADGKVILPWRRITIYNPETIDDKRSDNGRREFYPVYCREKDAIRIKYVRRTH